MSQTTARIICALAVLVAAPVVFTVLIITFRRSLLRAGEHAMLASGIVTALLFIVLWIVVWHPQVLWTRDRRLLTLLSIFWSVGVAVVIGVIVESFSRRRGGISAETMILACATWLPVWLVSTALIWRESKAERVARDHGPSGAVVLCPQCGYDMTGLREARCPECGTQYTLDQLLALARRDEDQFDDR